MSIAELLIQKFDTKIHNYFNPATGDDWKEKYSNKMKNIQHDEPWLIEKPDNLTTFSRSKLTTLKLVL